MMYDFMDFFFFFSSRRRHTRYWRDWSSDVCSSDLFAMGVVAPNNNADARAAESPADRPKYSLSPVSRISTIDIVRHRRRVCPSGCTERSEYQDGSRIIRNSNAQKKSIELRHQKRQP